MKYTLSTYEAAGLLFNDENANWSRAGAFALVEHLDELEDSISEEIDFCPVALRCDYSQYESLDAWAKEQWLTPEDAWKELRLVNGDTDELDAAIREYLRDRGTLLEFDGGIIVSSF